MGKLSGLQLNAVKQKKQVAKRLSVVRSHLRWKVHSAQISFTYISVCKCIGNGLIAALGERSKLGGWMKGADFVHCVFLRYVTLLFGKCDHVIEKISAFGKLWISSCFPSVGNCSDSQSTRKIGVQKSVFTLASSPFSLPHLFSSSTSYSKSFELTLAFAEESSSQPRSYHRSAKRTHKEQTS